jgi:hypothetical protein
LIPRRILRRRRGASAADDVDTLGRHMTAAHPVTGEQLHDTFDLQLADLQLADPQLAQFEAAEPFDIRVVEEGAAVDVGLHSMPARLLSVDSSNPSWPAANRNTAVPDIALRR